MNQPHTHPMSITLGPSAWMEVRLREARCILADAPQHPDSLVILAARVIAGQSTSASECADAVDVLCQLDRRPLQTVAAAAFPNGGAE
jgi:hypothetical protein